MANAVNEALIRDVIEDVLGRLGGSPEIDTAAPAAKPAHTARERRHAS